jgi:hypothetical protein
MALGWRVTWRAAGSSCTTPMRPSPDAARAGARAIVTTDGDFTELRGIRVEYVRPC